MYETKVSILCLTFNQKDYIRKCMEGFLMQKTSFNYEIIIHDDASTDGTAEIIREYEEEYPEIIRPIYQDENQYSKNYGHTDVLIRNFLLPKARGEYIAICEGDDFWTDSNKLQKQYEALRNNLDCVMCVHKVKDVSEDGEDKGTFHEYAGCLNEKKISAKELIKLISGNYCFQTSSYFFRKDEYAKCIYSPPQFVSASPVDDIQYLYYFATVGNIYYIPDAMSSYRCNSVGSWTNDMSKLDIGKKIKYHEAMIEMLNYFNEYTAHIYDEYTDSYLRRNEFNLAIIKHEYKTCLMKRYRDIYMSKPMRLKISILVHCLKNNNHSLLKKHVNDNNEEK